MSRTQFQRGEIYWRLLLGTRKRLKRLQAGFKLTTTDDISCLKYASSDFTGCHGPQQLSTREKKHREETLCDLKFSLWGPLQFWQQLIVVTWRILCKAPWPLIKVKVKPRLTGYWLNTLLALTHEHFELESSQAKTWPKRGIQAPINLGYVSAFPTQMIYILQFRGCTLTPVSYERSSWPFLMSLRE